MNRQFYGKPPHPDTILRRRQHYRGALTGFLAAVALRTLVDFILYPAANDAEYVAWGRSLAQEILEADQMSWDFVNDLDLQTIKSYQKFVRAYDVEEITEIIQLSAIGEPARLPSSQLGEKRFVIASRWEAEQAFKIMFDFAEIYFGDDQ